MQWESQEAGSLVVRKMDENPPMSPCQGDNQATMEAGAKKAKKKQAGDDRLVPQGNVFELRQWGQSYKSHCYFFLYFCHYYFETHNSGQPMSQPIFQRLLPLHFQGNKSAAAQELNLVGQRGQITHCWLTGLKCSLRLNNLATSTSTNDQLKYGHVGKELPGG